MGFDILAEALPSERHLVFQGVLFFFGEGKSLKKNKDA